MQIALIPSDPHTPSLFRCWPLVATDLQIPPEFAGGTSSKLGDTERVRNGSEEALAGPALVLARVGRKRDQQGVFVLELGRPSGSRSSRHCVHFVCVYSDR